MLLSEGCVPLHRSHEVVVGHRGRPLEPLQFKDLLPWVVEDRPKPVSVQLLGHCASLSFLTRSRSTPHISCLYTTNGHSAARHPFDGPDEPRWIRRLAPSRYTPL